MTFSATGFIVSTMKFNWKARIARLPRRLSYAQAAKRIGKPYQTVRKQLIAHRYQTINGHRTAKWRTRKINVSAIDWRRSNVEIARDLLCSRERIRKIRLTLGKPFVESRGRKPKKVAD